MKLDFNDIQHQEFKNVFRGYDTAEVRAFLEVISENYKLLQDEESAYASQIRNLKADNDTLKNNIRSLEKQIRDYQNTYSKMDRLMDSKIEADLIIEKARQTADKMIEEAEYKIKALDAEAKFLEAQKAKSAAVLKEYLLNQLAILNLMTDNVPPAEPSHETAVDAAPAELPPVQTETLPETNAVAKDEKVTTESAEIRMILNDVGADDLEIKEPTDVKEILPVDSTTPAESPESSAVIQEIRKEEPVSPADTDDEKNKKLMQDLEKLNQQATSMFRKADFNDMLGEEAINKSEDIINRIYSELEKKKNKDNPKRENV